MANTTHTHTLTFSLRDWRKGSELLERLGFNDDLRLASTHELTLTNWEEDNLQEELQATGLEWELQEEGSEWALTNRLS